MEKLKTQQEPILVSGNDKLAFSITVCLLQAGHPVTLCTQESVKALECINTHFTDMEYQTFDLLRRENFSIAHRLKSTAHIKAAIAVTGECLAEKKAVVAELEAALSPGATLAINTESIPLGAIQEGSLHPGRVIGANWVEPAHTTFFLEVISTEANGKELVDAFISRANTSWQKDAYLVTNCGIRAKLLAALVREACYMIENEYASIEDIDRACRNDAGYYLPFAGNFRYMDLMGTNAYGMVMQDLNRELSKDAHIPRFFQKLIDQGALGMENNQGFYPYQEGDQAYWSGLCRKFSYQIQAIISKYPFNYVKSAPAVANVAAT
ncbi:3-hydroxyacyl-CoA dehydrogenase family protein [soil metagenome]